MTDNRPGYFDTVHALGAGRCVNHFDFFLCRMMQDYFLLVSAKKFFSENDIF